MATVQPSRCLQSTLTCITSHDLLLPSPAELGARLEHVGSHGSLPLLALPAHEEPAITTMRVKE